MNITPAIKGQLTKAIKQNKIFYDDGDYMQMVARHICMILARHMPAEQAKRAARKYLTGKAAA
jgi:uncharacterized protein YggL (DUF469 family)